MVDVVIDHSFCFHPRGTPYCSLQAIYPMIIIVLVALGRSHMEKGLLPEHLQSLPTPNLTLMVNTTLTRQSGLCTSRLEALGIDLDEQSLRCGDSVEDSDTSERWSKADPMA